MNNPLRRSYHASKEVVKYGYTEVKSKPQDERNRSYGRAAFMAITQGADRLRFSVMMTPAVATEIMNRTTELGTHGIPGGLASSVLAGLGTGATFSAWNGLVGGSLAASLDDLPQTRAYLPKRFPKTISAFKKITPGINGEKLSTKGRLARGLGVLSMGNTAYVTSTALSDSELSPKPQEMNVASSIDGGVVTGGLVATIAFALNRLAESHPEIAQDIMNVAQNNWTWRGVAVAMIGGTLAVNSLKSSDEVDSAPVPVS